MIFLFELLTLIILITSTTTKAEELISQQHRYGSNKIKYHFYYECDLGSPLDIFYQGSHTTLSIWINKETKTVSTSTFTSIPIPPYILNESPSQITYKYKEIGNSRIWSGCETPGRNDCQTKNKYEFVENVEESEYSYYTQSSYNNAINKYTCHIKYH